MGELRGLVRVGEVGKEGEVAAVGEVGEVAAVGEVSEVGEVSRTMAPGPGIAAFLGQPRLAPPERDALACALTSSWCWPADPGLAAAARQHGFAPPERPLAGQSLLLSWRPGGQISLWRLAASEAAEGAGGAQCHSAVLVDDAARTLELAEKLAARDLPLAPVLPDRPLLSSLAEPADWRVQFLARHPWGGPGVEHVLDRSSFGLAMLLAAASRLLDTPLPGDLCALASLRPDGSLDCVGELEAKLAALVAWAPGIRRVLVQKAQQEEACGTLERLGARDVQVLAVADLRGALPRAFPDLPQTIARHWPDAAATCRAAHQLFQGVVVRRSHVLLDHRGVAATAAELLGRLAAEEGSEAAAARGRAAFARDVARRHLGDEALLSWPEDAWLHSFPRPVRLSILAHVVQSAADSDQGRERDYAERALRWVAPPGEEHLQDLMLLGAVGRALAAVRDHRTGLAHLERALAGYLAQDALHEATHALSEALRVLGILGVPDAVERSLQRWLPALEREPLCDPVSLAFVRLAAGRALLQVGRPGPALDQLDDQATGVQWPATPYHVQHSRLRWLARALDRCGRHTEAEQRRSQIPTATDFGLLARLDAHLDRIQQPPAAAHSDVLPQELANLLDKLAQLEPEGYETRRLLRLAGEGPSTTTTVLERARVVREEYRY